MKPIRLFVETGQKKTFAGAVDWPGWCRGGRDEDAALAALLAYASRYRAVLAATAVSFPAAIDAADLVVIERHPGNATTDFGAPAALLAADSAPPDPAEHGRWQLVLGACWRAFDQAVQRAAGRELRQGPRGGGRDLARIVAHVVESDQGYLSRLAWRFKPDAADDPAAALARLRGAVLDALAAAAAGELPAQGPRGGVIWPPRYFVRRLAWHVLDHAWEIEDRLA